MTLDTDTRLRITSADEAHLILARLPVGAIARTLTALVVSRTLNVGRARCSLSPTLWTSDAPPLTMLLHYPHSSIVDGIASCVDRGLLLRFKVERVAAVDVYTLGLQLDWTRWPWGHLEKPADLAASVALLRRDPNGIMHSARTIAETLHAYALHVGKPGPKRSTRIWVRWCQNAQALIDNYGATPEQVRDLLFHYVGNDDRWRLRLSGVDADIVLRDTWEVLRADRARYMALRNPEPTPQSGAHRGRVPNRDSMVPRRS